MRAAVQWTPVYLVLVLGWASQTSALARQPFDPPPLPQVQPRAASPTLSLSDERTAEKPEYAYGVGYAAPWQPASGIHWRKRAALEYYSNPPAPTWRWLTTGRRCPYDPGLHYGIGYPHSVGYSYPKYKREP